MLTMTASKPAQSRAPKLPAEERRLQIIDAAVSLFARKGYQATGTAEIAAAVGVAEPTIYRYFENKQDLYIAALRRNAEEVMVNWERIAAENDNPLNALLSLGQWYLMTLRERPELLALRFRSMTDPAEPEVVDQARETYLQVMAFTEGLFTKAKEQGLLSAGTEPRTMMWLFMAIGSLLDQINLLGLQDELLPRDLVSMGNVLLEGRR
jgi:AcrR family transcriptional regulator